MKLVHKISAASLALVGGCALVVGGVFLGSFRNLRQETYRWFDASGKQLATSIGTEARASLELFDYQALEAGLARQVTADPNLLYASVSFGEGLKERREKGDPSRGPHRAYQADVGDAGKVAARVTIHYSDAELARTLRALVSRLVIGSAASLAALVLFLYMLVRRLVNRPLAMLVDHARRAASGDLSTEVRIAGRDELGELAGAIGTMLAGLRETVDKVRRAFLDLESAARDLTGVSQRIAEGTAEQTGAVLTVSSSVQQMNASVKSVVASAEHLHGLAGESSSSMLEMAASVEEVAGNADSLSGAVERASSSIAQMTSNIKAVADHGAKLADLVTNTSSSLAQLDSAVKEVERSAAEGRTLTQEVARTMGEDGARGIERAAQSIREIHDTVGEAAGVVRALAGKSRDIGSILTVVNEVNEQTNLLALNAAILAAQAGEHGRGFAVVAEEIRELSARTTASTKEISRLIAAVQRESENAVSAMEEGTKRVETGVQVIEDLGRTLGKAASDSERASAAARVIAQATTEQHKGLRQISTASYQLTEMSQELARATREQSSGSALVLRAAEEMRELSLQVKRAMAEQTKAVKLTSRASDDSSRLAQQVLEATREEARGIELVARNTGLIQEVANTNTTAAAQLDKLVHQLAQQAGQLKQELDRFTTAGPAQPAS